MEEPVHRLEITKALCICWSNLDEEDGPKRDLIRKKLKLAGITLKTAVMGHVNFEGEVKELMEVYEHDTLVVDPLLKIIEAESPTLRKT
jgi:hypothetical protein